MLKTNQILANGIRDMIPRIQANPDNVKRTHEMFIRRENTRTAEALTALKLAEDLKEKEEDFDIWVTVRRMTPKLDGEEYIEGIKIIVSVDKKTHMDELLGFLDGWHN